LEHHRDQQDIERAEAGARWQDSDLVFATSKGTQLDAANVRRGFRNVIKAAGLDPSEWTPRELRHSFVSLMSNAGVPVEEIASLVRPCGHAGCARSCSAAPKPWIGSSPHTTPEP
jgi:site-specific recombinase XerD